METPMLLINGRLVAGDRPDGGDQSGDRGGPVGCAARLHSQLETAVAAAKAAFPDWSATPLANAGSSQAVAQTFDANASMLGPPLTQEQGKPLA